MSYSLAKPLVTACRGTDRDVEVVSFSVEESENCPFNACVQGRSYSKLVLREASAPLRPRI
eukprot:7984433-Lingulodinium_polyedra.AAC.1